MLSAQVLIIVSAAGAFAWLITTSGYPAKLVAFVKGCKLEPWMLLLVINVILLFVGSVLEPPAAILLLTPLLTPIAYAREWIPSISESSSPSISRSACSCRRSG